MAPTPRREPGQHGFEKRRVEDLAAPARSDDRPDPAEHQRLLDAAARGDAQARESLTKAHLDWVLAAARERADRGLSESDLFQEGTVGLLEAINDFPTSGERDFERFARGLVARRMDSALGDEEKAVRDSQLLLQAAQDFVQAEFVTRRELGRAPTDLELAAKLEWSVRRTVEIGQMVKDARRRHDEEILQYLE